MQQTAKKFELPELTLSYLTSFVCLQLTAVLVQQAYLEENSLRYAAGYIIRASKQNLKERHHPMIEILTYRLSEKKTVLKPITPLMIG